MYHIKMTGQFWYFNKSSPEIQDEWPVEEIRYEQPNYANKILSQGLLSWGLATLKVAAPISSRRKQQLWRPPALLGTDWVMWMQQEWIVWLPEYRHLLVHVQKFVTLEQETVLNPNPVKSWSIAVCARDGVRSFQDSREVVSQSLYRWF
jgi:hypothetical protein